MSAHAQLSPVQPGDTLAGRYRVERVIGVGGMGVVVAARHLDLDHLVAVKFLLPKVVENQDIVNRFAREARAAVRIQNEHVARVTDVGTLESGAPYMVMEYLEGTDFEDFARSRGPLPVEETIDFILQACEAIAEAHSIGIVHRDLKPGNLFLVKRPDGSRVVKVLDFGISKVTGPIGSNPVAPTTTMLGSPPYMSPEQLSTPRDVDSRSDIWALGIILYRLLTGHVPFDAETILELCVVIMHGDPAPIRQARADVPRELEAVILKCLQKDKARRFASVGELARALMPFAPERSRVSMERISHLSGPHDGRTEALPSGHGRRSSSDLSPLIPIVETSSSWGHTARRGKKKGRGLLLLLATIVVAAGAVFFVKRGSLSPVAAEPHAASTGAIPTTGNVAPVETAVSPPAGELPKPQATTIPPKEVSPAASVATRTSVPPVVSPPVNTSVPAHRPTKVNGNGRPTSAPAPAPPAPRVRNPATGGWEDDRK